MTITPEDKNWTWVLDRPCDECGCDTTSIQPSDVSTLIRANAQQWTHILAGDSGGGEEGGGGGGGGDRVRERPSPAIWSPLEYACHVRDVFAKFHDRLTLMLTNDDPQFDNWDQDATAVQGRYDEQEPANVAKQLRAGADGLAAAFDAVSGEQWQRSARRSDGAVFTVATLSRYFIHDVIHHVYDVTGIRFAARA